MIVLQIVDGIRDASGTLPIQLTLADWEGDMDEFGGLIGSMR